jgi:hypothetical protein
MQFLVSYRISCAVVYSINLHALISVGIVAAAIRLHY